MFSSCLKSRFSAISLILTLTGAVGLSILDPTPARAQLSLGDSFFVSPFQDYKEIKTPHFRIVFPKQVEAQALKAAEYYEEAHEALKYELAWEPEHLVNVLLLDNTDSANGLTSTISRFGMILYLVPPESWFSIAYYDDWLRMLIFHEYTHYLNMDATRGFYTVLRKIFGDVILPNAFWPSWMLEGLAVFIETKHSNRGRGRSPFYEMVLRTSVLRNKLNDPDYITLDQINGTRRPRAPYGEMAYLFGYQILNKIERDRPGALTQLTERSSSRVPYFINGNLQNITGKDFYSYWKEWVDETYKLQNQNLAILKSQPVTTPKMIPGIEQNTLGNTISPNGEWLAYTRDPDDKWAALYLKHLPTGKVTEIEDKFSGVGLTFSPDSTKIIYSSLRRTQSYNFFSDLRYYDLTTKKSYWISKRLRAKDPSLSPDGKWITFTVTQKSTQDLVIAPIQITKRGVYLSSKTFQKVTNGNRFDRIASPVFSHDGKRVYFSQKPADSLGENLMVYSLYDRSLLSVVNNTHMNRFPTRGPKGTIVYVSDQTGVDNLYQFNPETGLTTQITNVLTGITLPSYHPRYGYIASVYDYRGYGLGIVNETEAPTNGYSSETLKVAAPPLAPPPPERVQNLKYQKPYTARTDQVKDYTPWESLLPRQWAPIALFQPNQTYLGAQVFSYDTSLTHQYFLFGAYDTYTRLGDGNVRYLNRSLGVNLQFDASLQTTGFSGDPSVENSETTYIRKSVLGVTASYPFQYTIGSLTPIVGVRYEREKEYLIDSAGEVSEISQSTYVPTQFVALDYRYSRSSDFAVAPEKGVRLFTGVKRYDVPNEESYKFFGKISTFHELYPEGILSPSVRGILSSRADSSFSDANAVLKGRRSNLFSPFVTNQFDQAPIRGYPKQSFFTQAVYTGALDFATPIAQIFRGAGTNPLFVQNMAFSAFYENSYFPYGEYSRNLAAVGTGLRLNTEWFLRVPISFGVDYHQGLNSAQGGKGELFVGIYLTSLPFAL